MKKSKNPSKGGFEAFRGIGVGQNAGPARTHSKKVFAAHGDKATFRPGHDAGELGTPWKKTFKGDLD